MIYHRSFFVLLSLLLPALAACSGSKYPVRQASAARYPVEAAAFENEPVRKLEKLSVAEHAALGDTHLAQRNLPKALIHYEKAIELKPDDNLLLYKKGLVLLHGGAHSQAVGVFQAVLQKDPEFAPAHQALGRAQLELKAYAKAEEHFLEAGRLEPGLWLSHNFLGILYDRQGRYADASSAYAKAIRLRPQEAALYNNLGMSYFLLGNLERAAAAFGKAAELAGSDSRYQNNLGLALANLRRYDEALDAFMKAGTTAQAYNNLGSAYLDHGDFDRAGQCFEKALELSPGFYSRANTNLQETRMLSRNRLSN